MRTNWGRNLDDWECEACGETILTHQGVRGIRVHSIDGRHLHLGCWDGWGRGGSNKNPPNPPDRRAARRKENGFS